MGLNSFLREKHKWKVNLVSFFGGTFVIGCKMNRILNTFCVYFIIHFIRQNHSEISSCLFPIFFFSVDYAGTMFSSWVILLLFGTLHKVAIGIIYLNVKWLLELLTMASLEANKTRSLHFSLFKLNLTRSNDNEFWFRWNF